MVDLCVAVITEPPRNWSDSIVVSKRHNSTEFKIIQYEKALNLATKAHQGHYRKDGQKYIVHPVGVADILSSCGYGLTAVIGGLLHDALEDAPHANRGKLLRKISTTLDPIITAEVVKVCFDLCKDMTEIKELRDLSLRVKLADRAHNMESLEYLKAAKNPEQLRKAKLKIDQIFNTLLPNIVKDHNFSSADRMLVNRVIESAEKLINDREMRKIFGLTFTQKLQAKIGFFESYSHTLALM